MTSDALRLNGVNPQNRLTQMYTATVGLEDGASSFDAGIGTNPYDMSGSIMGNMGGMGSFGPVGGYGYGPGAETMNMTQEQYMKYQQKLQDLSIDQQVHQKHKIEAAEFKASAAEDVTNRRIGIMQSQIGENEQDRVVDSYGALTEAVREKFKESGYTNIPEEQVKAYAEKMYFEATGSRLVDDIKAKGDSSFVKGLKDGAFGIGYLFTNKNSSAETVAHITGEPVTKSDTASLWAGRIISGVLTCALLPFALKGGASAGKAIFGASKNSWTQLFKK